MRGTCDPDQLAVSIYFFGRFVTLCSDPLSEPAQDTTEKQVIFYGIKPRKSQEKTSYVLRTNPERTPSEQRVNREKTAGIFKNLAGKNTGGFFYYTGDKPAKKLVMFLEMSDDRATIFYKNTGETQGKHNRFTTDFLNLAGDFPGGRILIYTRD